MTVGAKQKSRLLTEVERVAIVGEYPGLRFVNFIIEDKPKAKPEIKEEAVLVIEEESTKPKRGKKWQDMQSDQIR